MQNADPRGPEDLHRRRIPARWEVHQPTHSVEEVWAGTEDFRLVPRDYEALSALFERNFATSKQMEMFTSEAYATNRLARLCREGLVARISVPRMVRGEVNGRAFAYSLTAFGLECLIAGGHRDAMERQGAWRPPYTTNSNRSNVLHDLAVGDLSNGIVRYFEANNISAGWKGARDAVQKANPMVAGGQTFILAPDAAVTLATADTLLIEYEESLRPDSFGERLANYQRYFERRLWESDYLKAPKVLISASQTADRQRYWANPFDEALKMAMAATHLYQHVYLIKEEAWRVGDWTVQPIRPGEPVVSLKVAATGEAAPSSSV